MSKKSEVIAVAPQPMDTNVRKAVEAIAIKPHAGKLTLLTRKINNVLLAEAQEQGIDQQTYRVPLSRLCSRTDYDSTNMQLVKEQLRKMASTTVEWNVGVKGSRRWGVSNLVNVEVIEEGNRCWIEWDYPVKLKAKLLAPEVYARLSLQMQNSFRSAAALALYEICVRYVDSPGNLTMRMPWEEWRPILTGVPDHEESTYTQYKYFKRDVIKPAVEEVTVLTHIEVTLIEHKLGRSISELQFGVKPKNQNSLPLDEPNLFDLSLLTRLSALGFSQQQAEKLYSDTEEPRLRATLDYVEQRLKKASPPVDNPQGYFRNALSRGYGVVPAGQTAGEKQKALAAGPAKTKPASAAKLTEKLAEAWWLEKRQAARATFDALAADEQEQRLDEYAATDLPTVLRKKWQDKRLKDAMCNANFNKWLVRETQAPGEVELLQYGLAHGLLAALE